MKLKKIASLMLAGVMAISMLTACGDNSSNNGGASSNGQNPTAGFTETVLAETSKATQLVLKTDTTNKLDQAVNYVAANNIVSAYHSSLDFVASSHDFYADAGRFMNAAGVKILNDGSTEDFSGVKDSTYYGLYVVDAGKSDEWIAKEVAELLDSWTFEEVDAANDHTRNYTVRVAKAECDKDSKQTSFDSIVVGIAITTDYSDVNY